MRESDIAGEPSLPIPPSPDESGRRLSILLIIMCQIAAMALWFSASAAVPSLLDANQLSTDAAAALTSAVQIGFVAGTLASAGWGLADRFDSRALFSTAAVLGALFNGALLLCGFDHPAAPLLRFATGMCMAGIYPVGMKLAAGWSTGNMGLLMGALVGAVTLGSAMPHLFYAFVSIGWKIPVTLASGCALTAALAIHIVRLGPKHAKSMTFRWSDLQALLRNKPILLAQGGYLGHMWELYAMWAWLGSFLVWALPASGMQIELGHASISLITFLVMGIGAIGCLLAGLLADRIGRTLTTVGALLLSGGCALLIGFSVEAGPLAVIVIAAIWGMTVVADSAQFSAAIAELAEPRLIGTVLTLQTSLGFLLTAGSIWLVAQLSDALGWRYAFIVLAIGPLFGAFSMMVLRRQPEAIKMAGGRR
ncbi:MFS transporter [Zwartia vadi]|uniref:MFS transporter n=1 Tax=Zwartia vadi TaxID=3058168 RepID=UPI0025B39B84|nr:MFS transporter [Zwartia vadi]MDN3986734.1 MFS transporter [Zwartia vadi]